VTRGILLLLASALAFAASSVFVKLITVASPIPAQEITFFRFTIGFILLVIYLAARRRPLPLRPVRLNYVLLRAFFTISSASLFYLGIQYTTVTNANMLNMTYPLFVFVLAPWINRERNRLHLYVFLLIAFIGMYLIVVPEFGIIRVGDFLALGSGLFAGFSITFLREARKYDHTFLIIFYAMAIGTVLSGLVALPFFIVPEVGMLLYLLLCALTALLGQIFLTWGYRYIDAAPGALVSATRIPFAAVLGIGLFNDPLTVKIVVGGLLIVAALAGISRRPGAPGRSEAPSPPGRSPGPG
jgi:drug/metabolite transporter (DMT)-like permease